MDQLTENSNATLKLEKTISSNLSKKPRLSIVSKDEDKELNLRSNEIDKNLTNIRFNDHYNSSKFNESNKSDLNSLYDIKEQDHLLDQDFIINNDKYFYFCKFCRITIGNDNSVKYESKFIELSNLFNVKMNQSDSTHSFYLCSICNGIVGFYLKVIKIDNKREKKHYLITDMVKINGEKEIKVGLFGLKDEFLFMFQKYLENLSDMFRSSSNNVYKLIFKHYKMTKESLNKNYKLIRHDEIDCAYIIHKNEGRLFLLGRNGYYNKLIEDIFPKLYGRVAIVLLNNQNTNSEEILEKLVFKGDQKSLQTFHIENKFFFVTDEVFSKITLNEEFSFLNLHFCFQQISSIEKNKYLLERNTYVQNIANFIDPTDKYLVRVEGPKIDIDIKSKITFFIENYDKIKNDKSNMICFML